MIMDNVRLTKANQHCPITPFIWFDSLLSSSQTMTTRVYDIILWGATGFTGELMAKHLHKTGSKFKIAVGTTSAFFAFF